MIKNGLKQSVLTHFNIVDIICEKNLDILNSICYNVGVAKSDTSWRDGRVGLRRTTGNRVYPNRYHGFESHSLRQQKENFCLPKVLFLFIQAAGLAYHRRTKCGAYHQGRLAALVSHHAPACISLRLDDIQCFALMICRSFGTG